MRRFTFFTVVVLLFVSSALTAQVAWESHTYSGISGTLQRADFNNDGAPDLLVNRSSVMLNDGHGGFSAPMPIASATNAVSAAILDFNQDGNNDLAVCTVVQDGSSAPPVYLTTMRGNGDGTFTQTSSTHLDSSDCKEVIAGDFNGDGKSDLAVIGQSTDWNAFPNVYTNKLSIYFGNGSGFDAPVVTSPIKITDDMQDDCGFITGVAAADFDGDGKLDLLVPTNCDNSDYTYGTVELAKGDGTGHFTFSHASIGAANQSLSTADVNQDGRPDAAAIDFGWGPHASSWAGFGAFLNNGTGTFTSSSVYSVSSYAQDYDNQLTSGVFGDFDGDGIKDAMVSYADGADCCSQPTQYLSFFKGKPDGTYAAPQLSLHDLSYSLIAADFDRDGRMDFALSNNSGVEVFLNRTPVNPGCAAPTALRAVSLCIPASGVTSSSAHFIANTNDNRQVKAMKIYVDGVSRFLTPDDLLNYVLPLSAGTHNITAKAWDDLGPFSIASQVTISSGSAGSCNASTNRTVVICSPASGSSTGSPVHILASVADSASVSTVQVYVDGTVKYTTSSKQVDTSLPMGAGSHRITVKAWDSAGSFSSSVTFTVTGTTASCPALSTERSINVCSPASGATVASPVHILATIRDSSSSYSAAKVYIDGTSRYNTTSKTIDTTVSLASGKHLLVVKFWEGSVSYSKSVTFYVQ